MLEIENANTIGERRSTNLRNRVFDCLLSPDWRLMAIENTVSSGFDLGLSIVNTS